MKYHLTTFALLAAGAIGVPAARAALIASESFWTTGTEADPQYFSGARFNQNGNGDVVVGNSGFAAAPAWSSNTGTIFPTNGGPSGGGLTHSLASGTVSPGATDFRVSHNRAVSRGLSVAVPASSSYFLSGMVRATETFVDNNSYFAMGFGNSGIASGLHIGMTKNGSGAMRLAAFGGGSVWDLGAAALDTTYMIVLELTADVGGTDSFDAWVAADGGSLSQVLTGQSLETFTGAGNLGTFRMQQVQPDTSQITRAWGDEIRFGTTLDDVVIPEPSTGALLGLVAGLGLLRRRRG